MVDSGEITKDIRRLFLKMIRNTKNIKITLEEVIADLDKMIIGKS